jgi:hypothetical protein
MDDLIKVNIVFLENRINKTLYHDGPIDKETIPLINKLKQLNDYGFMSVCGHSGLIEECKFIDKTWIFNGNLCGNWYISQKQKQKSYISGFMKNEKIDSFIKYIKQIKNYNCNIIANKKKACSSNKNIILYTTIGNRFPITIIKVNKNKSEL